MYCGLYSAIDCRSGENILGVFCRMLNIGFPRRSIGSNRTRLFAYNPNEFLIQSCDNTDLQHYYPRRSWSTAVRMSIVVPMGPLLLMTHTSNQCNAVQKLFTTNCKKIFQSILRTIP